MIWCVYAPIFMQNLGKQIQRRARGMELNYFRTGFLIYQNDSEGMGISWPERRWAEQPAHCQDRGRNVFEIVCRQAAGRRTDGRPQNWLLRWTFLIFQGFSSLIQWIDMYFPLFLPLWAVYKGKFFWMYLIVARHLIQEPCGSPLCLPLWHGHTHSLWYYTSECPKSSCTSFGAAPFDSRLLV